MGEEKTYSILEIVFKLIGGGVTPVASTEHDEGAAERLDTLLKLVASLLSIIRELMNRFSGSAYASCKTIGIMCTDFLREQGFEDEHDSWVWQNIAKPETDKFVEVLLKDGSLSTGKFDGERWWINDGFITGFAEGNVPMYSASSTSDEVRCWRNYLLPDGFKPEVEPYTL